jgi:hypothetical protein
MKIDGRCHCGYITYEADINPEKAMICHCSDCQTLSGSAFRTVVFTHEDNFPAAVRRAQDLREDRGERDKAATIPLPGMRNAGLFKYHGRRA